MPDDKLTQRIRKLLLKRHDVVEKRMFGGVAFMIGGHMACGTQSGRLVLRLGEHQNVRGNQGTVRRTHELYGPRPKIDGFYSPAGDSNRQPTTSLGRTGRGIRRVVTAQEG